LMIDHRASPGTTDVPEGAVFECATLVCSHCQQRMIQNPLRTRERQYCAGCDHYICDGCAVILKVTMQCQDIRRVFDRLQSEAVHLVGR
jgi:hypothetical protein